MKQKEDNRINAEAFSIKQFLLIFIIVFLICIFYSTVFLEVIRDNSSYYKISMSLFGAAGFATVITVALLSVGRKYLYDKPLRRIAEAAGQVAGGNFNIQIEHFRKDGKKDEVEVLIDDFNTMVKELSSIETLKSDFIANVSHEIKTPLSVIQSYAAAIQDDSLSAEERREYGKTIVEASKKLTELVTNILRLNKLENQEIVTVSEPFALDEQLRECVLSYEELWEKKNITMVGDDIDEVTVNCDKSLLELVWNNVISNAIKFTDVGGTITLSLKKENDNAVITIKDTGYGMNEETAARIFDKFYQGDTSHSSEGNGLGLALVKKVMALVGGEISIKSRLNEGTAVTITLLVK